MRLLELQLEAILRKVKSSFNHLVSSEDQNQINHLSSSTASTYLEVVRMAHSLHSQDDLDEEFWNACKDGDMRTFSR